MSPSMRFRPFLGALALAFIVACGESPTANDPAMSFAKSGHNGGGGGAAPQASFLLPAQPAPDAAGLFSDDGTAFTGTFDPDQMSLIVDCPRTFVLGRPAAWPLIPGAEAVHCSSRGAFSRLDLNDLGGRPCSDPGGCPIGTEGHAGGSSFSQDLNYYFTAAVPKTKGKGSSASASYNVVWVDARFSIDQTDGNGAPCRWHLWATEAEFWEDAGSGTHQVDGNQPMPLDVVVKRSDTCP